MLDVVLMGGLILGFALLLTAHLALVVKLVLSPPQRWRGAVALMIPPFAPLWGFRSGFTLWSILWVAALLIYALARVGAEIVR